MRASKTAAQGGSDHISGAEGLYDEPELARAVSAYARRALAHSRGRPDRILITVERLSASPTRIPLLPVTTEDVSSPEQARQTIVARLRAGGISRAAITRGISLVLKGRSSMRGAALIRAESGERCEPDTERGIRVSRLGMEKASRQRLSRVLAHLGINTQTVREALVLASKTASCPGVVAELCVSDDPDYTTGYVSSRDMGYVRVPSVKRCGSLSGGRIFFIGEDADPARIVDYLEKAPVLAWLP